MNQPHPSAPTAPAPSPRVTKQKSVFRAFLLGAGIEGALNAGWNAITHIPFNAATIARNALFSGIAAIAVNQLSQTKPVAQILEVPVEPPAPLPDQSTVTPINWVDSLAQSSQNCHTPPSPSL